MDIDFNLQQAFEILQFKLTDWLSTATSMLPNFVVAIMVLIVFYLLSRGMRILACKIMSRFLDQQAIVGLLSSIISFLVLVTGLIIALNLLHLSRAVTSLLTGAGIVGLALGFAFQDISANFISGVIMAFKKPIKVGDIIETNGYMGFVKEIQLRATVIETFQGLHVIIPNRTIFQNAVTNYTKTFKRRIDLQVGISYADDLQKVKEITEKAVCSNPYLTSDHDVRLVFEEFGSSSINFKILFWINYSPHKPNFLEARSEAIMAIKKAYDENGITIPFPIRTLDFSMDQEPGIKNRLEKVEEHLLTA